MKRERALAFESPFVSPNRLFPCGSGCNQNRFPIPEELLWGYGWDAIFFGKNHEILIFNELSAKKLLFFGDECHFMTAKSPADRR